MSSNLKQRLLVANRGEIALRIIQTSKKLGLETIAIYTAADSLSPHVFAADRAICLTSALPPSNENEGYQTEAMAYLDAAAIVSLCLANEVTLVHPGYGFLSENAAFASQLLANGITWLGPQPSLIESMGLKHEAKAIALKAGLEMVPGSEGLVETEADALDIAERCGYPIMIKATAGGGGMAMVICHSGNDVKRELEATQRRAKSLFGNSGIFIEKYIPSARHIEVQIFGDGNGKVVHMGERECSVQRRHQKVIEETPSPFVERHDALRGAICSAAVRLGCFINYGSAGTVEFLVDDATGKFYFLEMNTRIQVEHPITEETHSGLDLVELMILQGVSEREGGSIDLSYLNQRMYDDQRQISDAHGAGFAIEARIYAENPYNNFAPSPGLLQYVSFPSTSTFQWLRIDTWIETGMTITPYFDPLLAKVVVTGSSRAEAIDRMRAVLEQSKVHGPPNNIRYLQDVLDDPTFRQGLATTRFLNDFHPPLHAFEVIKSGIDMLIQDLPGRTIGLGIPQSGPMDDVALQVGNRLVGNQPQTEGLEIVVVTGVPASLLFHQSTIISITGKRLRVRIDGEDTSMWSKITLRAGGVLVLDAPTAGQSTENGLRTYLCVYGGFPDVPLYLGSKSTSMGLGGYQGRSLVVGDLIMIKAAPDSLLDSPLVAVPQHNTPVYPSHWVIYVLPGPHDDPEFITADGITKFYTTQWTVSSSSNRLGIRLQSSTSDESIMWARSSGGEGGSHPSNILDNGYAPGTINVNGDTPVILTKEGPDMGGYLCICTVATFDMWKLGQLSPGCTLEFRRIPWKDAVDTLKARRDWELDPALELPPNLLDDSMQDASLGSVLRVSEGAEVNGTPEIKMRQAGDGAILVEFGEMRLDLGVRARVHAFQQAVMQLRLEGVSRLCPCIRSIMCHYNPLVVTQTNFLESLVQAASMVAVDIRGMTFTGRRITFPIALDDRWNKEALERYMATIRDKAVYLPSNIDYLARNNGLASREEALRKLVGSDWLVLGIGFYLACPFIIPIDPRCRLIGQKMNPSRTYTPRGAIGIAGPVAAIYPIESPGGYQLYGRTLSTWQTWGKGKDFSPDRPWILQTFDQLRFEPVTEEEYLELERDFDAGRYEFKIEEVTFSMAEYTDMLEANREAVNAFVDQQRLSQSHEEERERNLLNEWQSAQALKKTQSFANVSSTGPEGETIDTTTLHTVRSSMHATIWKLLCKIGDVFDSSDQVLAILEAMKTEIPLTAGDTEFDAKRTVHSFGSGIREGSTVKPGDVIVYLK